MKIILFDYYREELLPLTFTRPVGDLRCGVFTLAERWAKKLNASDFSFQTEDYLTEKYPINNENNSVFINPCIFPNDELAIEIKKLELNKAIFKNDILIAANVNYKDFLDNKYEKTYFNGEINIIKFPWDLFSINFHAIEYDFEIITKNRKSNDLSSTCSVIGDKNKIFVEDGVIAEYCTLNTTNGSIYLGKNSQIMEGSNLRGPISLGENSTFNMGSKIYGGTTIGPYCKVGGEINNAIFWGYSSKGHHGYIGNSVIGQWCNFGAGSSTSNLKNNYGEVKCWSYKENKFIGTGLQFCGTIFGDHSKVAINSQLNTGTVVGVFSNIFTSGFPPNLVKSFSWGGDRSDEIFLLNKALDVAEKVAERRNKIFDDIEKKILTHIYYK